MLGAHIFQKSKSNIEILGSQRVTCSKIHNVDTNNGRHHIKFGAPLDKNHTTEGTKMSRGS